MSDEPGFGISTQAVWDLANSLHGGSAPDAFPAALVAPVWRALLEGGAIEAPNRIDLDGIEVLVTGPNWLELRVPSRSSHDRAPVNALPVWVEAWTTEGETLGEQFEYEAGRLAAAIRAADGQQPFHHYPGVGQKPKN